jgi:hypothetical protein
MKKSLLFLLVTVSTSFCSASFAQNLQQYTQFSVVVKADSTARSALLSDLMPGKSGYDSPIIGTASWTDNNNKLQCRSLLSFNYGVLSRIFKPEQIAKAQLVLVPLQVTNDIAGPEKKSYKFLVQRITEPWEDTSVTWLNQPKTDKADEVYKVVQKRKKDNYVKIDVTDIVRNMFRFSNNGFKFGQNEISSENSPYSNWFASAKNDNENARPLLIITFESQVYPYLSFGETIPPIPYTAKDIQQMLNNYIRPEPVIASQTEVPVKEPVKDKENN